MIDRHRHTFCFDIDNTLFDYPGHFDKWLQSRGHRRLSEKEAAANKQHNNYFLRRYPDLSRPQIDKEIEAFDISATFEDMALMPGLLDGWHALKTTYPNSLFIGLSSMGLHPEKLRMRKLQLTALDFDQFIPLQVNAIKAPLVKELHGEVLFEDSPAQLEAAMAAGIPTVAVDWPFNQSIPSTARLKDWRKVVDIVAEVLQKSSSQAA